MMKKTMYAVMTAITCSAATAQAGLIDFTAGADMWFVDAKGYAGDKHSFELRREYDNRYAFFAWMNLEHPLPLVPNLGVRYGSFDHTNNGIKADMSYGDLIGYYNLIDITPIKADLGLGLRFEDFVYKHDQAKASYNDVLPYAFGHASLDIVGTSLAIDAEAAVSDLPFRDDTKFLDAKIGLEYRLGGSFIEWRIDGGYRYMYLSQDTSNFNDLTTIIKGPYAGISGSF